MEVYIAESAFDFRQFVHILWVALLQMVLEIHCVSYCRLAERTMILHADPLITMHNLIVQYVQINTGECHFAGLAIKGVRRPFR